VLKESGARLGEAFNVTWDDIDVVQKKIRITPEKGSDSRLFEVSNKLLVMLHHLPRISKRVWTYKTSSHVGRNFRKQRKKIAYNLEIPDYS
jgi:integrase